MSKDYICKDCVHNNHGWCKALKRNKLKEIDKCAMKNDGSKPIKLRPFEEFITYNKPQTPVEPKEDKCMDEAYRVLGKRDMLWNVQRQALAIKQNTSISETEKFKALCQCINSLSKTLEFSEKLYEVDFIIESEIDEMMIQDSKKISKVL